MNLMIKGMDMPKNCNYCRFNYDNLCHALQLSFSYIHENDNISCPLSEISTPHGRLLDPRDENVGTVLECAIKWTIGRKTYMVSVVTGVISPIVPDLNNKTLLLMEREIVKHERFFDSADRKEWIPLRDTLRREIDKRNLERWK